MSIATLLDSLNSRESGLTREEAAARLASAGANELPEPKVPGPLAIFFSQFLSPLIYVLIASAAIVFFLGETEDAIIILLVLVFNAVIGAVQEGKAQNALRALRQFVQGSATVMRGGVAEIVPDREVVPGDILVLREGEKIPADGAVLQANSLRVEEAALTGESMPVAKSDEPPANRVFKGTHVVGGDAVAVATATGVHTEIGKISQAIAAIDEDLPLKRNIAYLSRAIIVAVIVIAGVIMALGLARGEALRQMFATVVSLAVSVIPEGLPIVMTLVLAAGVWRMSKQQVLVKKLQAVEGLGQAKIIAVDKTGTLTRNEMTLQRLFVDGKTYEVSGVGYEPVGEVSVDGKRVEALNHPELILAARVAGFCANANAMFIEKEHAWKVAGDPTEAALGVFARKLGFVPDAETPRTFEVPFSSDLKYHLAVNRIGDKHMLSMVGAPERILELSSRAWHKGKSEALLAAEKAELEATYLKFSRQGYRVVAFAFELNATPSMEPDALPPLTFGGFFAIRDPLRQEAKEAVRKAHAAGIRVVMITGDHKTTAHAIALEAGIAGAGDEDKVITGAELERLPEHELAPRFAHCNVFARVTPQQKLKIISVFKQRGETVAMTGDGVNDAPSLAAADLGVAMGVVGTEVAKEAADLVLLDDNFGNIPAAVEEGRSIYKTIKKVALYLFSTGIGEVVAIAGSIVLGLPLPVLPAQIIWLNFVTDGFLVLALAMEPKERTLLTEPYKPPSRYLLDAPAVRRMAFLGVVIALGSLWIFDRYLSWDPGKALTVSLTALAIFQWFNAWNCRSDTGSVFAMNPLRNPYLILATVIVAIAHFFAVYNPFMQRYLHTVPLDARDWLAVVAVAATIVVLEEVRKVGVRFVARRRARSAATS